MRNLSTFTSAEASEIGAELDGLGTGAQTMEHVANSIVRGRKEGDALEDNR